MAVMKVIRGIKKKLLSGFMLVLPLGVTIFFLNIIYNFFMECIQPILKKIFPDVAPPFSIKLTVTVIILLMLLLLLYILGHLTSHFIGRMFWRTFENILLKVPLFNSIYKLVREIIMVFSDQKSGFREVVFIHYPGSNVKVMGFITGSIIMTDGRSHYKVFMPTAPNPTSGFLLFVTESEIVRTDITVEEGVRIVVSGGILGPESALKTEEEKVALLQKKQDDNELGE